MTFIDSFRFPSQDREDGFFMEIKRTCYDSYYPFRVLSKNNCTSIDFTNVTILYGGNGSGKSTALNVIAEKLNLTRNSNYNKSNFFSDYVNMCEFELSQKLPENSRIITSDDVFDYILNIRYLNDGIDNKREELFVDYQERKESKYKFESLEDYEQLKKFNKVRLLSQSKYVRSELVDNVREYSNGESAFDYFVNNIKEDALYILDEPENSLSPTKQLELRQFLEESARFFGCQFIISTHSPFLLSIPNAKIYNLDVNPVKIQKWTELENVLVYHDFFKRTDNQFK